MDTSLFHGNMVTARRIIYTPSVFAKNTLLYLQETGALQARKPHTSARKNLPSFLFFIVRSGEGTLTFQGNIYALRRGDCIFLDCSEGYSHTTSENLWELEWVHFSGRTMREIYGKYMERGGSPVFHPDTLDAYLGCLSSLYALAASEDYIRDMRINEKLSALLSLIMEESWHPENAAGKTAAVSLKRQSVREVKEDLDLHYAEEIRLDDLARKYGFNKFYLTRDFREQYGVSIVSYLHHVRITKAKQLLRFSGKTVEEISSMVGISDANYFSRLFRKIEGMSPLEYRSLW